MSLPQLSPIEQTPRDRWVDVKSDLFVALHPSLLGAFDAPDFDRLEVLGGISHLGRPAVRALAAIGDWEQRNPHTEEAFPPADEYELIVDAHTGVLLRAGSRFDGGEFSVLEMTEVAFAMNPSTRPCSGCHPKPSCAGRRLSLASEREGFRPRGSCLRRSYSSGTAVSRRQRANFMTSSAV
ncbi:MAG: hypothetical protein WD770_02300 [Actinomycetota bacterium]